jgi:hypothetical protein
VTVIEVLITVLILAAGSAVFTALVYATLLVLSGIRREVQAIRVRTRDDYRRR